MGIDPPALSRLETGRMLNPTLATLHKWAEALGQKLHVDLSSPRSVSAGSFRVVAARSIRMDLSLTRPSHVSPEQWERALRDLEDCLGLLPKPVRTGY
jgi:transcriptional regulator with XRE-family HTH domain